MDEREILERLPQWLQWPAIIVLDIALPLVLVGAMLGILSAEIDNDGAANGTVLLVLLFVPAVIAVVVSEFPDKAFFVRRMRQWMYYLFSKLLFAVESAYFVATIAVILHWNAYPDDAYMEPLTALLAIATTFLELSRRRLDEHLDELNAERE